MEQLGVGADEREERICYIRPDEPLQGAAEADLAFLGDFFKPHLVVIDGVTEFFALHGWDINSATDTAKYQKKLLKRFPGELTAIEIDHTGKDGGGRGAIGSQHKRAGIDGATYFFRRAKKVGGRGGVSEATLSVRKDREGMVRPQALPNDQIALLRLDSTSGVLVVSLLPPGETDRPATSRIDQILRIARWVRESPRSTKELRELLGVGQSTAKALAEEAEAGGFIQRGPITKANNPLWCPGPTSPP
jgi:hypothetical protein